MYQSKNIVRRSLTALLALLMVLGTLVVGSVGALAEETTELKLKTFTGQQLFEAAQDVGNTNEEDILIYTSYQDAIGRKSLQPDNWMIHSAVVRHLSKTNEMLYRDNDELRIVVRLMADDSYTSGDLFLCEFAYDATQGRDDLIESLLIDETTYEAAETKVDETTGVAYKEFDFFYLLNHEDFDDATKEGQLRVQAKNQAPVTVYFMGVYNETTGATVIEYDGVQIGAQAGIDGYYENVYPEEGAVTGVASYSSDHGKATGRDWNFAPYCFNAFGANRENPYLLLEGLGAELPAGEYALDFEMSTMIALITTDKCNVAVYDENTELASMIITEAMVNSAAGKDTGAYAEYRLQFTVPEESAGHNINFKIFLFDSNDIKFRNVRLYKLDVTGPMPDDAKNVLDQINALAPGDTEAVQEARAAVEQLDLSGQAWVGEDAVRKLSGMEQAAAVIEAIAGLGSKDDVNADNYTDKTEALEAVEKIYNDFVKTYGRDSAEQLITNAQALKEYRDAYDAAELEAVEKLKAEAVKAVEDLIAEIGDVTPENYVEKKDPIEAAEAALNQLLADYGQSAVDSVSNLEKLADARAKYEEYIEITDVIYGDINEDTKVDANDALMALQHSVKITTLEGDAFKAADVNGDGKIDASDALYILQFSVKLINHFPVEDAQ